MRLTDEIRNLQGRKQILRDRKLRSACHEASHALYAVHAGLRFISIEVNEKQVKGADTGGRLKSDPAVRYTKGDGLRVAQLSLAGHAFEGIIDPHHGGLYLMLRGSANDVEQAADWLCWSGWTDKDGVDGFIDRTACPPVRKFLLANWGLVMKVGAALASAGKLSYREVRELAEA